MTIFSSCAIIGSVYATIIEVNDTLNDDDEHNDYTTYIVVTGCLIQTIIFGAYTALLIRHMYHHETDCDTSSIFSQSQVDDDKGEKPIAQRLV